MVDSVRPFEAAGSPRDIPEPVAATYLAAPPDQFIRVEFTTDLERVEAADFHRTDWVVFYGNWATNIVFWSHIEGRYAWLKFVNTTPRVRPDVVSYNAVNQDVRSSRDGSPAKPFLNFPIT
jgi:hypothetical protein